MMMHKKRHCLSFNATEINEQFEIRMSVELRRIFNSLEKIIWIPIHLTHKRDKQRNCKSAINITKLEIRCFESTDGYMIRECCKTVKQ